MRYLTLYAMIVSLSLRRSLAFRANLAAEVLLSIVNVIASLVIVRSVFWVSGSLDGWTAGEATMILGLYLIGSGLLDACVEPNLRWFRDQILQGQLDEMLVRPASSAFLASLGTCEPLALTQSFAGAIVFAFGLAALDELPSATGFVLATGLFARDASRSGQFGSSWPASPSGHPLRNPMSASGRSGSLAATPVRFMHDQSASPSLMSSPLRLSRRSPHRS